ncbi:hypothetical protein [Paractinoplanes brasiliensis]|uniref:Uncharacterized protein n=1 Tax=Paractinoplanes brasiliensis TaxID=52695 RepID=A0A4R6JBK0_9ACTN|nr:hypothetical protein [Actinoplanes brasiliensis]TDO32647.1 hypothetical protein C8E87_8117 [Actinoplanes brasiliensis]GID32779.1 hypothetical protein Abr02nite_77620 [Actinoplanes brasiliensis]
MFDLMVAVAVAVAVLASPMPEPGPEPEPEPDRTMVCSVGHDEKGLVLICRSDGVTCADESMWIN